MSYLLGNILAHLFIWVPIRSNKFVRAPLGWRILWFILHVTHWLTELNVSTKWCLNKEASCHGKTYQHLLIIQGFNIESRQFHTERRKNNKCATKLCPTVLLTIPFTLKTGEYEGICTTCLEFSSVSMRKNLVKDLEAFAIMIKVTLVLLRFITLGFCIRW